MTARRVLTAVAVVALLLTACGGDDSGSARPEPSSTDVPATTGDQASTPSTVTFYTPPDVLNSGEPGDILETEPLPLMDGINGEAVDVTYVSTTPNGDLVPVTGVIVTPASPAPDGGRPVVTWAHGTTGVADRCAPSNNPPFGFPGLAELIDDGYVVAATDYYGLGTESQHPYLVGQGSARSVIDIARAAIGHDEFEASDEVAAWGASQGGHAVLFVREIIGDYAPDMDMVGIVASAPVTDLNEFLLRGVIEPANFPLTAEAIATWETVYDEADLETLVPPELVDRYRLVNLACTDDIAAATEGVDPANLFRQDPQDLSTWQEIVRVNTAVPADEDIPMLILHGTSDELVPVSGTRAIVEGLCEAGEDVEYVEDPTWGHVDAWVQAVPEIEAWIVDRFAREPPPSNCGDVGSEDTGVDAG